MKKDDKEQYLNFDGTTANNHFLNSAGEISDSEKGVSYLVIIFNFLLSIALIGFGYLFLAAASVGVSFDSTFNIGSDFENISALLVIWASILGGLFGVIISIISLFKLDTRKKIDLSLRINGLIILISIFLFFSVKIHNTLEKTFTKTSSSVSQPLTHLDPHKIAFLNSIKPDGLTVEGFDQGYWDAQEKYIIFYTQHQKRGL